MTVGSICTRRVVTVDTNASLSHAAALMRDHHVGALVDTAQRAEGLHVVGLEHEAAAPKPAPTLPPGLLRIPAMGTAGWGQGGAR